MECSFISRVGYLEVIGSWQTFVHSFSTFILKSTPGPPFVQENDIFLDWEKGTGKKWGKSKRKGGTDLSLEEMKKQAAVKCLRSASDEVRPLFKAKVFKSVCYLIYLFPPHPFSLLNCN